MSYQYIETLSANVNKIPTLCFRLNVFRLKKLNKWNFNDILGSTLLFSAYVTCSSHCVRNIVENCVHNGSTANVCAIDLSKAFDRMNHFALFVKLMNRNFPLQLLTILETWFRISKTCVKWDGHVS